MLIVELPVETFETRAVEPREAALVYLCLTCVVLACFSLLRVWRHD